MILGTPHQFDTVNLPSTVSNYAEIQSRSRVVPYCNGNSVWCVGPSYREVPSSF